MRIDLVRTSGVFSLDGEDFDVENNVWLVGDDHEVVVVDAAHDAGPILDGVAGRAVRAVVCTHGHNDHINAAVAMAGATGRSFSDRDTLLASIRARLLTLAPETLVHTGHGPSTTIGTEATVHRGAGA